MLGGLSASGPSCSPIVSASRTERRRSGDAWRQRLQSASSKSTSRLAELRTGLGEPIPPNALAKIERLLARSKLVLAHIAELERERDEVAAADAPDRAGRMIQRLTSLRRIGVQSATVLVREAFVRHFSNGKALGSYAGLTSTP
jgi:transposase